MIVQQKRNKGQRKENRMEWKEGIKAENETVWEK